LKHFYFQTYPQPKHFYFQTYPHNRYCHFPNSKFCIPKFCTDCEPEIDTHDNQPLELKCNSLEMYSTVIESFVMSEDTLPIEVQELVESECLFYCFMGYCTSDCKSKDKHKTVWRSYYSDSGDRFKRLLQFRDAARRSHDSTMSESANFAWNDFAKCHFCSEEYHLRDLIGQAEYPSPLSCRTCLLRHAQNTFDCRRKSLSIQDGSYITWPYDETISIQAYVERLALSFKSTKPLDIASQAYDGYLYDDEELKSFLGIQEVNSSQYKKEQKRQEMAAISIQKTFRCFRIKWRYEDYVGQFVDGNETNDDGEAIPKPAKYSKNDAKQFDPKSSITRDEASRMCPRTEDGCWTYEDNKRLESLYPDDRYHWARTYNGRDQYRRPHFKTSIVTIETAAKGVYVSWAVRQDGDISQSLFAFAYDFKNNYRYRPHNDLELRKQIVEDSCSSEVQVDYEYDLVEDWKVAGESAFVLFYMCMNSCVECKVSDLAASSTLAYLIDCPCILYVLMY